ncbi:MAG: AAA family ATPase [Candidatus Omnitrophica bacterium]|nr:AAA family ATPase [Candidatus Omnitrophota bacterium]
MIIGLTGKNGGGKGEAVKFLAERGFVPLSLSDVLRDEARSAGQPVTRDVLVELGNRLRKESGPGVLAERIFARLDPEKNYIIDSIRHPAEAQVFRRRRDFSLVHVQGPQRLRFERLRQRGRENDPRTFEEFLALEAKEAASPDSDHQQLDRTISSADATLENGGPLRDLHEKIKRLLLDFSKKELRPDWDDYFIGIAKMVALRSNCIKRKVAAVIVKDRRIISTGYNGTPRGVKNCSEGGCPRCNNLSASGKDLEECLCSHAEENSITQAAYHGVTIKESTLYTTYSPCLICTKMIINAGIREVVYNVDYDLAERAKALLEEGGVVIRQVAIAQPLAA